VKFRLEKIDVAKLKSLYHLRGYKKEEDDNYCTSMALLGRANNTGEDEYEILYFYQKRP
jgi:hypothetical protein